MRTLARPVRSGRVRFVHALFPALILAVTANGALAAQENPPLWERVRTLIEAGDADRARAMLSAGDDPVTAARRYDSVVRSLYDPGQDLPAVVRVAQDGIEFCLARATEAEARRDAGAAVRFRGLAKTLAYNLASYTWPGWDAPGIGIRTRDLQAGHAAARLNLELAQALEVGSEPMANAYFMLGAHSLAANDYTAAADHFRRFGEIARRAGLTALALAAEGYGVITGAAAGSGNPGTYMLEPTRERLREALASDADFWIDQLDTAWSIFVTG